MDNYFDLTNKDGFKKAVKFLGSFLFPQYMIINKLISPEKSTEKQTKAAIDLIKKGKENGVKKMTIKVNHEAGLNISSAIESLSFKIKLGNSGSLELDVEYV